MDLASTVDALATSAIPMPKELDVVALGCATDAALDALNEAAGEAGALGFSLHDGCAIAFAKVHANPWDLAEVVDRLRELSRSRPAQVLTLALQPDGSTTTLRAGAYDEGDREYAALASWVTRWPRPQAPEGELRARLTCTIAAAARAALRADLARYTLVDAVVITDRPDGLEVAIASAPEIGLVLASATGALLGGAEGWRCALELTGVVSARYEARSFETLFALGIAIDALVRDRPRKTRPAAVIALTASPALAAIVAPEHLELEVFGDAGDNARFALGTGGEFTPLPPRGHGLARELGTIGDLLVTSELVDRQLGRLRTVISVRDAAGNTRASEPLINASGLVLDAPTERVLAAIERDGALALVAIDAATLVPTTIRSLGAHRKPTALFGHEGAIYGLVSDGRSVALVRFDDDTVVAHIPSRRWEVTRAGDRLTLVTASTEADNAAPAMHLHELTFDGALATIPLSAQRNGQTSRAGEWFAFTSDTEPETRVFRRLELRRTIPPVPGRGTWSIAVSPTGATARVTQDDQAAELEVFRGSARVAMAVPLRTGARWRT